MRLKEDLNGIVVEKTIEYDDVIIKVREDIEKIKQKISMPPKKKGQRNPIQRNVVEGAQLNTSQHFYQEKEAKQISLGSGLPHTYKTL